MPDCTYKVHRSRPEQVHVRTRGVQRKTIISSSSKALEVTLDQDTQGQIRIQISGYQGKQAAHH
jgi:predicted secreted protein